MNKYNKKLNDINVANLIEYDREQYNLAIENDIYSQLDQTDMQKESTKFEKDIEKILLKYNIKYKTQEQLTEEQFKKYGKAINTPDFLIESELIINGHSINWIDAKNFYGSNNSFVIKKITKQISKYIKSYGSGCIIFNSGFNERLCFDDVLLLNFKSINMI